MIRTLGELREALRWYDDDTKVSILFECTEAVGGFQYEVPILTLAGTSGHVRLCHEADYEEHYSKIKSPKGYKP